MVPCHAGCMAAPSREIVCVHLARTPPCGTSGRVASVGCHTLYCVALCCNMLSQLCGTLLRSGRVLRRLRLGRRQEEDPRFGALRACQGAVGRLRAIASACVCVRALGFLASARVHRRGKRSYKHARACTHTHTHTHAHAHSCTHSHTHTHTQALTHTRTHTQ